ncbi:AraC family transcriptional regulator [Allostella vacuolata]|nr:AraC family transcriptional regulator [Stella vacuolata]
MTDPLSDVISLLRPHTAVSKPITGRGEWGVRYPAHGVPGFAIVLAGHCWLAVDGKPPARLDRGAFVLLPASPAFAMFSRLGAACVPGEPSSASVRHGEPDGEPDFQMLGGTFQVEAVNAPILLELLPDVIHVPSSGGQSGRLGRIVDLIMEECASQSPGRDMILARLLEVMLVEALRHRPIGAPASAGLLDGLRDPALAAALRAMHGDVRARWTVAGLAKLAGMSRSAFAARFEATVGCAPIEYLARWRMALAQDALGRGGTTLDRLADEIGYESASAFSTAFRRRLGCSPGAFARRRRSSAGG